MNNYKEFRRTLEEALPLNLWDECAKVARRSTLARHQTGAILFNRVYGIISKGCSHHSGIFRDRPSVHAEAHAIREAKGFASGMNLLIVTLTKPGNFAYSSRPCIKCLLHANKIGIQEIIYAERLNDLSWVVNQEKPSEMIERASRSWNRLDSFAKEMRLVYE